MNLTFFCCSTEDLSNASALHKDVIINTVISLLDMEIEKEDTVARTLQLGAK